VKEPSITINGVALTLAQAATIRVAMESFAMELKENGLGDDHHGLFMTASYLGNITEIRKAMYKPG